MVKKYKSLSKENDTVLQLREQQTNLLSLLNEYRQLAKRMHEIHKMFYDQITDSLYSSAIRNVGR